MARMIFIFILALNVLGWFWFAARGGLRASWTPGQCLFTAGVYLIECVALAHYWPES